MLVHGQVSLPPEWEPPEGMLLVVTLEDVSRADARSTEIARLELEPGPEGATAFSLEYDAESLDPRAQLAVRCRGVLDGRLVATSTTRISVPAVPGTTVEVPVEAISDRRT